MGANNDTWEDWEDEPGIALQSSTGSLCDEEWASTSAPQRSITPHSQSFNSRTTSQQQQPSLSVFNSNNSEQRQLPVQHQEPRTGTGENMHTNRTGSGENMSNMNNNPPKRRPSGQRGRNSNAIEATPAPVPDLFAELGIEARPVFKSTTAFPNSSSLMSAARAAADTSGGADEWGDAKDLDDLL